VVAVKREILWERVAIRAFWWGLYAAVILRYLWWCKSLWIWT